MSYSFDKLCDSERLKQEIENSSITIALDYITTISNPENTKVFFKAELSETDEETLGTLITNHINEPLPENRVTSVKMLGSNNKSVDPIYNGVEGSSGITFISHDLGDRSSWYQRSVQVVDETMITSDDLTYSATNGHWINIYSKRLMALRNKVTKRDGTHAAHSTWDVVVKVNDVILTSGYIIDYSAGTITFDESQEGNTIKVSYWHTDGVSKRSEWILKPPTGKTWLINHVELQFSKSVVFEDIIRFEVWAGAPLATLEALDFSDMAFDAGYGQMRADYQDIRGIISQANLGTGTIPAMAGAGLQNEVCVFPFNYIKRISLNGDLNMMIRILMLNDVALSGADMCNAAFYTEVFNN